MRETTVKQTRGVRSDEYQTAFVNALKAIDEDKEMQQMYQNALRDIAETVLDMDFNENNEVKPFNTDVQ